MEGYQYDIFKHMDKAKIDPPTNLFVALLKNEEFKKKFKSVFEDFANNIMSLDKANPIIQEFNYKITTLIGYTQSKWWGYFEGTRLKNIAYAKNNFQSTVLPGIKNSLKKGKNMLLIK